MQPTSEGRLRLASDFGPGKKELAMIPSWQEFRFTDGAGAAVAAFANGLGPRLAQVSERVRPLEVVHLNSTPAGGGVAEILSSLVPLSVWHDIATRWLVIPPNDEYFRATRKLHDLLQGERGDLTPEAWQAYFSHNRRAEPGLPLADGKPRAWFVHDYQLLPVVEYLPAADLKIWVSHIDTSQPNSRVADRLLPYIRAFDRVVFSLADYVLPGLDSGKVSVCPPAIDPSKAKNAPLAAAQVEDILTESGVEVTRPLIAQISRFDLWKDPLGVIDAYRLAKRDIPGLQLALIGALAASDDAQAVDVLARVIDHADNDPDVHLYWDPEIVTADFVNAFQTAPQVILQKSLREGFGLTVTEAMWKSKAVIGGACGGIRLQIEEDVNGFLVSDTRECAVRMVELLSDANLRHRIGGAAHASVEERFLMPRLMHDYLSLLVD